MLAQAHTWTPGDLKLAKPDRFQQLIDQSWGPHRDPHLGATHAILVAQGGRLVFERYGDDWTAEQTHPSWSMAKSITQALVGVLVKDGKLDIYAPADVPEWRETPGDHRAAITLDMLLRMSGGQKFIEDYVHGGLPRSDVLEMLYHSGKADMAHYAAIQPLDYPVDTHWHYASGSTNLISRAVSRALGVDRDGMLAFMRERLFEPLGMKSPTPKFDAAGTFIGSAYCFCSGQDFLRFGQLYLNDGVWEGQRILPQGWVDYTRTPTRQPPDAEEGYGAQWWLGGGGPGSFSANGFEGQRTMILPDRDTVIVRLGKTPLAHADVFARWIREFADCFR